MRHTLSESNATRLSDTIDAKLRFREGVKSMKSGAFQARHELCRMGQSPLGSEELATTSSSEWNLVECASEGLILFFRKASLFIGMTPASASIFRIEKRLNRVGFLSETASEEL